MVNDAKILNIPLSMIIIDLDDFKEVNDNYGHLAGDHVLQSFAHLVESNLRDIDIFGRIGGDEFAIFLPETRLNKAKAMAERIRLLICKHDFSFSNYQSIPVSISVGITTTQAKTVERNELLNQADKALYAAKDSGRNAVKSGICLID